MLDEHRLLLHASRAPIDRAHSEELRALAARVRDWEWVRRAAERHSVEPLLHRQLAAAAPPELPPHIAAALRARSDENALRNLTLTHHLVELVAALEERGVPVMPIKGPVLALTVYGDITLRRFGDLDILVPRERIPEAREVLRARGFRTVTAFSTDAERALARSDYHVAYARMDEEGVKVELHWALTRDVPGTHVSEWWAWRHSRAITLLGRSVMALREEALLVYLCIHGSKHAWARLAWICDVAELLRGAPALDWHAAAALARECGAARMLPLGVSLARDLLDAPGPAAPAHHLAETARVRALATEVKERLFDDAWDGESGTLRFQLRTRERFSHRAAYLIHLLTAPHVADVEAVPLPGALRPLYRVVRPIRLVLKKVGVASRT